MAIDIGKALTVRVHNLEASRRLVKRRAAFRR